MTSPVRVWKDVLHPGEQFDRHGVKFAITPHDCRQAKRNLEKMLARGLRVPAVWEHQSDAGPTSADDLKAAYAKHTFGSITAARVDPSGVLWCEHEVTDARDAEQLKKTKFVSPKLFPSYSDSRGGRYRGTTVAHVAATPTPVQFWQRPFELSQGDALYLSYSPEGEVVADEKGEKKDEGGKKGDEKAPPKTGDDLSGLIKALKAHGLNIPESVDDLKTLTIAVQANGGAEPAAPPAEPTDEELDDLDLDTAQDPMTTTAAGAPPMLMSDDRAKGYAAKDRQDYVRRAKKLFATGRVSREVAKALVREFESVQLSYTAAGELHQPPKAVARLEAYEELPKFGAIGPTGGGRELSATRAAAGRHPLAGEKEDAKAGESFLSGLKERLGTGKK